jgi:cation diffusion facilitator CzcD-associated flavoprotein CzcO
MDVKCDTDKVCIIGAGSSGLAADVSPSAP